MRGERGHSGSVEIGSFDVTVAVCGYRAVRSRSFSTLHLEENSGGADTSIQAYRREAYTSSVVMHRTIAMELDGFKRTCSCTAILALCWCQ